MFDRMLQLVLTGELQRIVLIVVFGMLRGSWLDIQYFNLCTGLSGAI